MINYYHPAFISSVVITVLGIISLLIIGIDVIKRKSIMSIKQTLEEVAEGMELDPKYWAKLYLDLKDRCDKLEVLITKHQAKLKNRIQ